MFVPIARGIIARQNGNPPPDMQSQSDPGPPEIGGSTGGFIALIVVLSAIVLICCLGVFFLLRSHRDDPYERHARRVLAGKHEVSLYEMPLGPPGIRQKFKKLFAFGRKKDGWVRANSGEDEWDASDRLIRSEPRDLNGEDTPWVSGSGLYDTPPSGDRKVGQSHPIRRSETSDSIELTVPTISPPPVPANPMSEGAASVSPPERSYTDPFATSPTSMESSERLPADGPSPRTHEPDEDRRFSVQSGNKSGQVRSMRKFESGTKFKEALDF